MATQSDFGWELPDLSDVADGPDAFLQFADDIAATVKDGSLMTYTPSWTSSIANSPPGNPSSRFGAYRILNKVVDFVATIGFGSSTTGGYGTLRISLPVPANPVVTQQIVNCLLYTPMASASWTGLGAIDSTTSWQHVRPMFPVNNSRSDLLEWASVGGFLGLSVPSVPANPGNYSVQSGGYINIHGRYFSV